MSINSHLIREVSFGDNVLLEGPLRVQNTFTSCNGRHVQKNLRIKTTYMTVKTVL